MRRCHRWLFVVVGLVPAIIGSSAAAVPGAVLQRAETLFRDAGGFWARELTSDDASYKLPTLTLFSQQVSGACSAQQTLSGPFYCPTNLTVYLDEVFLQQVVDHTPGAADLALAYVIGHEVAHHTQNLLGTMAAVEQARSRSTPEVSARTWATEELQADCYTGLWVRSAEGRGKINPGPDDVSAALAAVSAVGRERTAHLPVGQLMVDPFTYGTAAQRLKWFRRGLDSGRFDDCDAFSAEAAGEL